jgi:putative ABC transport system ATP-binding protein
MKSKKALYIIIILVVALAGYAAYTGVLQPTGGVNGGDDVAREQEEAVTDEASTQDAAEDEMSEIEAEAQARAEEVEATETERLTQDFEYENGEYEAVGSYTVPNGTEHTVQVVLAVESDEVTRALVYFDGQEEGQTSTNYQAQFLDAVEDVVVGQALGDVSPSRVGGASLTTQAFNDAVGDIRSQAS